MNIYLTTGTKDFMNSLKKRYQNESMVAMHGVGNSVLLHETKGKTLFQTPRQYEVISSTGDITENGFFAFNHIPVADEGRPIFEHQFLKKEELLKDEPGFIASRLLRPLSDDTYIIMTEWSKHLFFDTWKGSSMYNQLFEEDTRMNNANQTTNIFSSAPYVTTFTAKVEDEEDEEQQ